MPVYMEISFCSVLLSCSFPGEPSSKRNDFLKCLVSPSLLLWALDALGFVPGLECVSDLACRLPLSQKSSVCSFLLLRSGMCAAPRVKEKGQ